MIYVERNPPTFEAVQFKVPSDHPNIKLGYKRTYRHIVSHHIFVNDKLPDDRDCVACWVLSGIHNFDEIKVGDWVVNVVGSLKLKVYSDAEFQSKFMAEPLSTEFLEIL